MQLANQKYGLGPTTCKFTEKPFVEGGKIHESFHTKVAGYNMVYERNIPEGNIN